MTQDDTSECGESFRDSRKTYGTSRFGEKLKKKLRYGNWKKKSEEKRIQMTNFENIREVRGKQDKKK